MENDNFENVEKNIEESINKAKKQTNKKKGNTVVLIVIALVLVMIVGITAGIFIASKENEKTENTKNETTDVNTKEENKSSKKVNESKDWVYEADYLDNKEGKTKTSEDTRQTYKSSEEIKLPYVNINSDDAKKVNEEIKLLAEEAYNNFGKAVTETDGATKKQYTSNSAFEYTSYKYEKYINNNILSIVIKKMGVVVPGDGTISYITYNFDLETLKLINVKDVLQQCKFKSQSDFDDKLKIEMKNLEGRGEAVSETFSTWDGKRFFVKDGKVNVVVPGLAMSECIVEVSPNAVAEKTETTAKNETTKETAKTETTTQNKTNSLPQAEIVKQLSPSGWAGSSMQEIRLYKNGEVYHITYNGEGNTEDNIISAELIAKNVESIEEKARGQAVEGIVIKGENVNKVKENVESWIIFENKTNSLPQVKIVKQLSPSGWAGSSMQEIRLYENGEVYHVTYNGEGNAEDNIISAELIAKNVESIEEKARGQAVEGIVIKGENVNKVKENVESWIIFE